MSTYIGYLAQTANNLVYHNFGHYILPNESSAPFGAPEGWQWIQGNPPSNGVSYLPESIQQQLEALFNQMPVSDQLSFALQLTLIRYYFDTQPTGFLDTVKTIIQEASPATDQGKSIQTQMLNLLPGG